MRSPPMHGYYPWWPRCWAATLPSWSCFRHCPALSRVAAGMSQMSQCGVRSLAGHGAAQAARRWSRKALAPGQGVLQPHAGHTRRRSAPACLAHVPRGRTVAHWLGKSLATRNPTGSILARDTLRNPVGLRRWSVVPGLSRVVLSSTACLTSRCVRARRTSLK